MAHGHVCIHIIYIYIYIYVYDAPLEAPYDGLTVSQARESIDAERQELQQVSENVNLEDMLSNDPALISRYIDHCRLSGELEAIKWLAGATRSAR